MEDEDDSSCWQLSEADMAAVDALERRFLARELEALNAEVARRQRFGAPHATDPIVTVGALYTYLCVHCRRDLGAQNGRQLCEKTRCPECTPECPAHPLHVAPSQASSDDSGELASQASVTLLSQA